MTKKKFLSDFEIAQIHNLPANESCYLPAAFKSVQQYLRSIHSDLQCNKVVTVEMDEFGNQKAKELTKVFKGKSKVLKKKPKVKHGKKMKAKQQLLYKLALEEAIFKTPRKRKKSPKKKVKEVFNAKVGHQNEDITKTVDEVFPNETIDNLDLITPKPKKFKGKIPSVLKGKSKKKRDK